MKDIRSDIHNPKFNVGDVVYVKSDKKKIPHYIIERTWVRSGENGEWCYTFDTSTTMDYEYRLESYNKEIVITTGEWISVNDEMPDYGVKVMFSDGEDVCVGCLKKINHNDVWCVDYSENQFIGITHWMRIPKIPK